MKRLFLLMTVLLLLTGAASANSWGARGWTIDIFQGGAWEDYTSLEDTYSRQDDFAQVVAASRYHYELVCLQRVGKKTVVLATSTAALYQPDQPHAGQVALSSFEGGFTISYPGQLFRFALMDEEYVLTEAHLKDGSVISIREDGRYSFRLGGEEKLWNAQYITLERFSISLFPVMEEVEALNSLYARLGEGNPLWSLPAQVRKKGTAAVYSAPDQSSWRAAKGKAAVSLGHPEDIIVRGSLDGWDLIEYKVSRRTSRIGYIKSGYVAPAGTLELLSLPGYTTRRTYITDDPFVSQYAQEELMPGQPLTVLGYTGECYAYVDWGSMRGFVPLNAIALEGGDIPDELARANLPRVQEQMSGMWRIWAGGDMLSGDRNLFDADGRCEMRVINEQGEVEILRRGRYCVTPYDSATGLSWADPPYLLTILWDDGRIVQRGLDVADAQEAGKDDAKQGETMLSLTNEEGGGGYERID